MSLEIPLMWAAVVLYVIGSIGFVIAAVFRLKRVLSLAFWISMAGIVPHIISDILRWIQTGHGPYLGFYESVSSFALFSVIAFGLLVLWRRSYKAIGPFVMPLVFLLLGAAMLAPKSAVKITSTLASLWLTIHVIFAQLSYTSLFIAFVLGITWLVREKNGDTPKKGKGLLAKLPDQIVLDDTIFRFIAIGFIFWTIMIVSGAIWANQAWGRYWGWDAIETWSLITWLVYAVYLHLRLTMHWKGRKAAIYAVAAMPVVLFSLIGVPILFHSIHAAYLKL